jgi:hypothetical protein
MTQTPRLFLPLIAAAQAQKHVTHNEALALVDALLHLAVASRGAAAPPAAPAEGERHIVGNAPSGAWAGHSEEIAEWVDGAWRFHAPRPGWLAIDTSSHAALTFDGTAWRPLAQVDPVPRLGINTVADVSNRLSIKSDAALFSHDDVSPGSGDMRIVLNKQLPARTASFLFQTGFSGRAEIGTTGGDGLSFKVSANGNAWTTAVHLASGGQVGIGKSDPARRLDVDGDIEASGPVHAPAIHLGGPAPALSWRAASGALNGKNWDASALAGEMQFRLVDDANGAAAPWLRVTRTAMSATGIALLAPVSCQGAVLPQQDNVHALGSPALRWSSIHAATGVISTSDRRLKTDIAECLLGLDFVRSLKPKLYRWRDGGPDGFMAGKAAGLHGGTTAPAASRPGRRLHAGFMAQQVKEALDASGVDCALWVKDDPQEPASAESLRYDQLLAPLVRAVQELAIKLDRLEARG